MISIHDQVKINRHGNKLLEHKKLKNAWCKVVGLDGQGFTLMPTEIALQREFARIYGNFTAKHLNKRRVV